MDKLESLGNQISQMTMYDLKSYYNQAKNIILNVSEMEAKVQEATNDEAWGASSTLMNEIAQGTFNFQNFNEIMPAIYSRFMEKEARQWRQIYKALQLLEYLIKNGSERTVDDARSHVGTIKMLRNFHYIDEKGKDQGINVRNRAREIVELLGDLDKIRSERRKAKTNKSKYVGTGNDGLSFSSGGSRYGGFGSDQLYGSSGGGYDRDYEGSYSGGGGYGARSGGFNDSSRSTYPEYDAGDDEDLPRRSSGPTSSSTRKPTKSVAFSSATGKTTTSSSSNPAPPPKGKAPAPEVDLLGGLDEEVAPTTPEKTLPGASSAVGGNAADSFDDFGDFEVAPTSNVPSASALAPVQPQAQVQGGKPNLFSLLGQNGSASMGAVGGMGHTRQPSGGATIGVGGGMGTGMVSPPMSPPATGMGMGMMSPTLVNTQQRTSSFSSTGTAATGTGMLSPSLQPTSATPQLSKPLTSGMATGVKSSAGGFEDLWNMSLGSSQKKATNASSGKSIQELEREKAQKGLWGAPTITNSISGATKAAAPPTSATSGFGNFGSPAGGGDDNLLL